MSVHFLDWAIVSLVLVVISCAALTTRKYTKSVADFLAANRCAGKYLLGVADGIAGLGAISIVALFEMYYKAGFTAVWWSLMMLPIGVIRAMTGWIQYRYRETRALTMAQFLEMRYSRKFRIFAGFLCFVSGIMNFAIFPAVGGRFFQYFMRLGSYPVAIGSMEVDVVYALVMIVLLIISLSFTFLGGQIAVIVTDFLQGVFCNIALVVLGGYLLFFHFDWSQMMDAVAMAPADASLLNPMKTSGTDNFNVIYFLIAVISGFIVFMSWQGNQGYYAAAKSPHVSKMGRVLGSFRLIVQTVPLVLLPVCAYTLMHHDAYSVEAAKVSEVLSGIGSVQVQDQLRVTVAATHMFPVGLSGLFAAVMFAAFISTHDTYLHSWGSIFIQDVLLPIRSFLRRDGKPLEAEEHIRWLKGSIIAVAIFIFLFSLFFNQKQDIFMFMALTGTIFVGWAGVTIVGGLYWKHGNSAGAWAASICGFTLALLGWYATYYWESFYSMTGRLIPVSILPSSWALSGARCPVSAQILFFWTIVASLVTYVVLSLLTAKGKVHNMDKMLHRGDYAVKGEQASRPATGWKVFGMGREFQRDDKIIYIGSYLYVFVFFGVFLLGTIYALKTDVPDASWGKFWYIYCIVMLVLSAVIAVCLAVGGFKDLKEMFRELKTVKRDESDDGTVL